MFWGLPHPNLYGAEPEGSNSVHSDKKRLIVVNVHEECHFLFFFYQINLRLVFKMFTFSTHVF